MKNQFIKEVKAIIQDTLAKLDSEGKLSKGGVNVEELYHTNFRAVMEFTRAINPLLFDQIIAEINGTDEAIPVLICSGLDEYLSKK